MSKDSVADWSTTANDNTDVGGINIGEGCAMANLNNAAREMMAQIRVGTYLPGGADVAVADGGTGGGTADAAVTNLALASYFPGHLYGLTLSNSSGGDTTNDIDIAAGVANDSTNARVIKLVGSLTKRLDAAWAVGTNQGGLDTGSIADTTYHMWLIMRSDTGVVDVLFSASATAPTMPTNYDYKRRIGSIVRTGAAVKAFKQDGDRFIWAVGVRDYNQASAGTSAITQTLTLPTGIVIDADITFGITQGTAAGDFYGMVTALDQPDTAPSATINNLMGYANAGFDVAASPFRVKTNTSAQIRTRSSVTGSSTTLTLYTNGWFDTRGRLA